MLNVQTWALSSLNRTRRRGNYMKIESTLKLLMHFKTFLYKTQIIRCLFIKISATRNDSSFFSITLWILVNTRLKYLWQEEKTHGRMNSAFVHTWWHSVLSCVCVRMCAFVHARVTFGRAGRVTGELALTAAHRSRTPAFSCSTVTRRTHSYTHTQSPHWPNRLTYEWRGQFLSLSSPC